MEIQYFQFIEMNLFSVNSRNRKMLILMPKIVNLVYFSIYNYPIVPKMSLILLDLSAVLYVINSKQIQPNVQHLHLVSFHRSVNEKHKLEKNRNVIVINMLCLNQITS